VPNTVKVPESFASIFTAAEKQVEEYFKQRSFNPRKGTIDIFSDRYILLRGKSLSVEFFQLCRKLFSNEEDADNFSRNILYELAHSVGKADAKAFHKKMNLEDPIAKMSAGPIHFAHTGWASVEILDGSTPTSDNDFFLAYNHPYSFESEAWLHSALIPHSPVCVMNAGYSSGWCEQSFGLPLEAKELSCKALGHDDCLFVMATADALRKKAQRYLQTHHSLVVAEDVLKPQLDLRARENKGEAALEAGSIFSGYLLTYARNLESTKTVLNRKIDQLNGEIEARRVAEYRLEESESRWRNLNNALFDCVLVCSGDSIVYANESSHLLFSKTREELLDLNIEDLFGQANWLDIKLKLQHQNHKIIEMELELEEQTIFIELQLHVMSSAHESSNAQDELILAIRDISERVLTKRKLERLANIDTLTGLLNRQSFTRIVTRQIAGNRNICALLFMDLNKFKQVNDTLGHKIGDLLLYEVGRRIQQSVRGPDSCARIGGDEFTVWLPDLKSREEVEMIAARICEAVESTCVLNNHTVTTHISIGIALSPADGGDLESMERKADAAMYHAKADPNNPICFFDEIES
jgi:diguanylate cyclase (GGDEF)-like protein